MESAKSIALAFALDTHATDEGAGPREVPPDLLTGIANRRGFL